MGYCDVGTGDTYIGYSFEAKEFIDFEGHFRKSAYEEYVVDDEYLEFIIYRLNKSWKKFKSVRGIKIEDLKFHLYNTCYIAAYDCVPREGPYIVLGYTTRNLEAKIKTSHKFDIVTMSPLKFPKNCGALLNEFMMKFISLMKKHDFEENSDSEDSEYYEKLEEPKKAKESKDTSGKIRKNISLGFHKSVRRC